LDQSQNPDRSQHVKPADAGSPEAPLAVSAPPLTPLAWLLNNGIYLLLMIAGAAYLYKEFGLDGLWRAGLVVLGLGFVIFIHELGHFAAAKWCDVHVQTFSIGFGPALPGCSFQRGETMYKIGILPLGGYVNMIGEGPEADEDEDYPRSFKNKTVGQRMLIISAGVIMNVLLGAICFVVVYRLHGVPRPLAVVWRTEPGSPAWKKGVQSGWVITRIDHIDKPWFDDLKGTVALSSKGQEIPFVFQPREGPPVEITLEPRKDANDLIPVIGVAPPPRLKLPSASTRKDHELPVGYSSPDAAAREMDLQPGDVVVRASDPAWEGELTPLAPTPPVRGVGAVGLLGAPVGQGPLLAASALVAARSMPPSGPSPLDFHELCRRMRELDNRPLVLEVRRAGAQAGAPLEKVEVPARGFDFDDTIVGTTDPRFPHEPFRVKALPPAPPYAPTEDGEPGCDPFEFRRRLRQLAGLPIVIQVRRHDAGSSGAPVNLLLPPVYHLTLGLRMQMGPVAAVRAGSPAANAGLQPGDVIRKVSLSYDKGPAVPLPHEALDPVRLPFELARRIAQRPDRSKWQVTLTVTNHGRNADQEHPLTMSWDESWADDAELPASPAAPMAVPELGLAYRVESTIVEVAKGSPAAKAGLQPNDRLDEIRFRKGGRKRDNEVRWTNWFRMESQRDNNTKAFDEWACAFFYYLQHADYPEVEVKVWRGGAELTNPVALTPEPDTTWPQTDGDLLWQLLLDTRLQKADTMWEALIFGKDQTWKFIKQIYLNLSSLLNGRISTKSLGGPIEIASQAFSAADDMYTFLLFLGIISVNLAVVNFLPIPVLDGGHMVFLIYEWLRGQPPSETVRAVATYAGLAMIASLMIFVFYLDIKRRVLGM
jgi:membrane-associated protease RseP (regulator of RpoE activity)